MKTPKEIIGETGTPMIIDSGPIYKLYSEPDVIECMREYARETLKDYEAWKAHSTPELVERYINEKTL